jgi:microcystin-dependent protein
MKLLISLFVLVFGLVTAQASLQKVPGRMLNMPGVVLAYAGSTEPDFCKFAHGQELSQATYAGLYAVLSTTYNTGGEGAGNFRMPDMRGRTIFGDDNMGGSTASRITNAVSGITGTTLGATGGDQAVGSHTHTMGNHTHTIAHTHTFSGTTSEVSIYTDNVFGAGASALGLVGHTNYFESGTATHSHTYSGTTSASSAANSGAPSSNTSDANASAGVGANIPPAIIMNWCITI